MARSGTSSSTGATALSGSVLLRRRGELLEELHYIQPYSDAIKITIRLLERKQSHIRGRYWSGTCIRDIENQILLRLIPRDSYCRRTEEVKIMVTAKIERLLTVYAEQPATQLPSSDRLVLPKGEVHHSRLEAISALNVVR